MNKLILIALMLGSVTVNAGSSKRPTLKENCNQLTVRVALSTNMVLEITDKVYTASLPVLMDLYKEADIPLDESDVAVLSEFDSLWKELVTFVDVVPDQRRFVVISHGKKHTSTYKVKMKLGRRVPFGHVRNSVGDLVAYSCSQKYWPKNTIELEVQNPVSEKRVVDLDVGVLRGEVVHTVTLE